MVMKSRSAGELSIDDPHTELSELTKALVGVESLLPEELEDTGVWGRADFFARGLGLRLCLAHGLGLGVILGRVLVLGAATAAGLKQLEESSSSSPTGRRPVPFPADLALAFEAGLLGILQAPRKEERPGAPIAPVLRLRRGFPKDWLPADLQKLGCHRQPGQPGRQIWLYEHLLVLSAATPPLLLAMAERSPFQGPGLFWDGFDNLAHRVANSARRLFGYTPAADDVRHDEIAMPPANHKSEGIMKSYVYFNNNGHEEMKQIESHCKDGTCVQRTRTFAPHSLQAVHHPVPQAATADQHVHKVHAAAGQSPQARDIQHSTHQATGMPYEA
ncbi:hypothetical protein AK812_SmicGene22809 [Symbiodinium microadriaticum]|uniref:Uncharacterized protein n=1 Tax=Symbiodinium microadriaticum TaxID=2951 RepID=A0A1Q9DIU0_SYMMI|nr:hypothetical protein AK812_SmicGene22809 [Symbiodinium microadriaticum]